MNTATLPDNDIEELLGHDLACEMYDPPCDRAATLLVFIRCCGHRFHSCQECLTKVNGQIAACESWTCGMCNHTELVNVSPWASVIPI